MDPFPPPPPVVGDAAAAAGGSTVSPPPPSALVPPPPPPPAPEAAADHGVLPHLSALRIGSSGGGVSGPGGGSPSLESWRPGGAGDANANNNNTTGDSGGGSFVLAGGLADSRAGSTVSGGGGGRATGSSNLRPAFGPGGSRSSFAPPAAGGAATDGSLSGAAGGGGLAEASSPAGSVVSLPGSRTPPPFALGSGGDDEQQHQQHRAARQEAVAAAAAAATHQAPRPLLAELEAATAQAAAADFAHQQQERQQHQQQAYEAASLADAARALADADALLRPSPLNGGEATAAVAGLASSPPPSSPPRAPGNANGSSGSANLPPPTSARRQSAGTAAATAAASRRPFIIGVAGGTASGKTTVCDRIMQRLNDQTCAVLLSQDSFYKPLNPEESERAKRSAYNFDVPDAFDTPLLLACLAQLCNGRSVDVPVYDFSTHSRIPGASRKVEPAPVIVVEGILVLAIPEIRDALSMKVYVDTDDDVRLARRIQRDVAVRGRDVAGVIAQYQRFVKPAFDTYIGPSRRFADVIIPWQQRFYSGVEGPGVAGAVPSAPPSPGGAGSEAAASRPASSSVATTAAAGAASPSPSAADPSHPPPPAPLQEENAVAIDLIAEHIRSKLRQHPLRRLFPQLEVIPSNFQLRGLHTILRDRETEAGEFAFFADRVNRLLIEAGLGHLPFTEKTVVTPTGHRYVGVAFCRGICGVSVIRSGEAMEAALRDVAKGIKIGKILVHRHGLSQEEVVYERLPADIAERHVLILDPVLGTGHTACRAIQVVLARGVPQHRVLFLCMIATPEGVSRVARTYPAVKIVTSEVDARLDERWRVVPGIGQFGDRYFGL